MPSFQQHVLVSEAHQTLVRYFYESQTFLLFQDRQKAEEKRQREEFERQEKERLQVIFIFLNALKIIIKALGVSCLCLLSILSKIGGGGRTEGEAETAEVA